MRRLTAILVAFVLGCASVPQLQRVEQRRWTDDKKWASLSEDVEPSVAKWYEAFEAAGVDNPFMLVAHGATKDGRWAYCPGTALMPRWSESGYMDDLIELWRGMIGPDRPIVLITCNECGYYPNHPNVWYCNRSVWVVPGPDVRQNFRGQIVDWAGDPGDFKFTGMR
jgi:hypothetical protein